MNSSHFLASFVTLLSLSVNLEASDSYEKPVLPQLSVRNPAFEEWLEDVATFEQPLTAEQADEFAYYFKNLNGVSKDGRGSELASAWEKIVANEELLSELPVSVRVSMTNKLARVPPAWRQDTFDKASLQEKVHRSIDFLLDTHKQLRAARESLPKFPPVIVMHHNAILAYSVDERIEMDRINSRNQKIATEIQLIEQTATLFKLTGPPAIAQFLRLDLNADRTLATIHDDDELDLEFIKLITSHYERLLSKSVKQRK